MVDIRKSIKTTLKRFNTLWHIRPHFSIHDEYISIRSNDYEFPSYSIEYHIFNVDIQIRMTKLITFT